MPIYEYKGQQYELSTTDPAEAKAKILSYLEKQGAPATPKPTPKPTPTPAVAPTSPVAAATAALTEPPPSGMSGEFAGFADVFAPPAEPQPRKTFTGSVFDTEPFNPPFDPAEAARLSNRAYAERTMRPPARRLPGAIMTATPEREQRGRTVTEGAVDSYIGLMQGGAGFFKGILDNIPGQPGEALFGGYISGLEEAKTPQLRSSQIAREGRIARARELEGETGATRAAFQTLFTPAGADIMMQGAGSLIPSIGMSVAGLGQKAIAAANMLANAGDAAVQSAEQLKKISPEQWSKNGLYQDLREKGLSHRDAVAVLAPILALPAQTTGAAAGYVAGTTGFERALTRGTERGLRAAAGRAGAEFGGEQLESLAPQFVGNLIASTLEPKISPVQGLGQTAVETAAGALPGTALAALPSRRMNILNDFAQRNGYKDVQDMIQKTRDRGALEDRLIEELDKEADARDAQNQLATQGAQDVSKPVGRPSGAGVSVAGEPAGGAAPGGVAPSEPSGVVPPATDVGQPPAGEGAGPGAVAERDLEGRIEPRIDLEALAPTPAAPLPGVTAYGQKLRAMTDEELKDEDNFGSIFNSAEENEILKAEVARRKSEQAAPAFNAFTAVSAQQTPMFEYITGINPQLDAFYNDLYSKPLAELPEALQRYRSLLDGANDALSFIKQRLATWNHPAIQFKTPAQRAEAKSKASAEDRELLDIQSEIAGAATRLASQAMALHKGYKGKKAGSQEKIDAANDQLEKDFKRAFGLMYSRGLLTDEDAAVWEEEQKREAAPASAPAVTERRVKDEFGNAATEVTLPNGSVHTIQRLNATESMGLPGWHLAGATASDIREGSFLGNTKQEAIQELTRRETQRQQPSAPPSLEERMRAMTDAELDEIIDTPWLDDDEHYAAKAEQARRKGVPPQTAPADKPEPSADLNTPESPVDSVTPPPVEDKPYYGSDEINALGDQIKTAVDKITSDFMVGDMVRYGNINGVVVGVDDAYVKVHPDGAKSPKAYHRVPKSSVTLVARPDTTSKTAAMALPGEDKKFGAEQGKLNADMGGLIQLLGANMYASSVAEVTVKELLQNAFDAVKGAISGKKAPSLYKSGNITITFNDAERTITITDDARGMTPEIVRNAFFTVAGSDKSDLAPEDRSGGLGLAKMGFMMGSERLILDTVRDGVRVRVDTNAKDIANSNFQLIKTPAPKGEHGTSVTVKIPEFYIDPKTGEQKNIYFSGNPEYYDALQQPLIGPVTVNAVRAGYGASTETLPVGLNFPADKYVQFKVNFGWGSADIYFSKERNPSSSTWGIKHQVLSSGVYQFNTDFKLSPQEKIPYDIIVNIKSSVEAKHPDYPFENSRERFKKRLEADIGALQTYLAQIARGNEAQDLQENFKNIVSMPRIEIGQDVADASTKLRKAFDQRGTSERRELPPMPKEVTVSGTQVVVTGTGKVLADTAKKEEKQAKETFKAEKEAPDMKDFLLQMAQNPNQPIFHNNTNVDLLEVGRPYGNPEQFFAELGTLMVEMKEALANSGIYGYEVLKPENLFFGGVSVDKGYGGVHIKVPYKAVLVNPFYDFGAKTLFGAREYLWETMTHEIAHTGDMGHGVGHNTHMLKVRQYLADEGLADYFRDALMNVLTKHESTFTAMREAYGRSTTKNTAKSLSDYEKGSASISDGSAASSDPDTVRPLPAGGRPAGDGAIRTAGPLDTTSGIPRAAGSTAPTSVKGLHQDVVDAINRNDIRGALQAIARNTSGLYSELARRLATLNLPTSIIFNNARALVKQIIDDRSAQQQIRLFAYLSREAPAFYDKYFKDYDKSENLERVAEGLAKIESAGINLAPVNTELAAVQDAYRKNLPGLTAPGFFAPTLDVVNISPDAKFGSDYRVVLHEIVHAATEYMLFSDFYKIGLTPEQSQAIADLYEMYNYAQTKIPPGEYGFTKISEFVAEIMTNPKFQAKLKGIPYKREKTSLFNSFVRYVGKLFGLRNLTGAAMSAVNDIMSPQRPTTIKPSPLRFAPKGKRVRGPISKPDTWRTAEAVETSIKDVIADATTGRVSAADAIKDLTGALWSATGTGVRFVVLPLLQLRQLKDLTRTKFPQIIGAVNIVEQMVAYRGKKIKAAEDIVHTWSALQSENPRQSGLMGRIMLEATIRGRDPDAGVPSGAAPDALDNAWNALKPEFKQLYRDTRDFYADSVKEMVRTMKQRALGLPKAERQAMIRKINEQFGPDKLVKPYFPLRRFGTHWFQIGKGDFKEFYTFESAIARNLAFSKRRRQLLAGNAQQRTAADTMRMGDGISELFSQNVATTQVLRNMEDIVDGLTATDVASLKAEIKDSINQLVYLLLPEQSMRKMFINRKAIQGASGDMLRVFAKTAVHSAYQQARFKYAEPFLNNVNNARGYIDELETAHAVTPQQGAVYRDYVRELENRTKTVLGVEDTSPIARAVGAITNTTFFFMLSAPASALLNTVGMATLTMPRIGARYGYAKTNALMLKNAGLYGATMPKRSLAPLVNGNFMQVSFPSIVEGANLSPLLKRAANRFVDDGDINISMTNDIFDMSELPSDLYTGKTNTVKKAMAGLFHQGERFNREVALLTVFELAYDKFLNADRKDIKGVVERDPATNQPLKYTPDEAFELAIQEARDIAGLTLGDYTRQMKGRIFTIPGVNLVSQFKQYAITATYNVLRDFYLSVGAPFRKAEIEQFRQQMIKDGLSPSVIDQRLDEAEAYRKEVYREGQKRLAGVLGMTFMFGGLVAQPFFSMLGGLIGMFAPDDDDEFFDWENWFYNFMENEVGGAAAAIFTKMGMDAAKSERYGIAVGEALARGPVATITGTSLADRVSLDLKNLWWREGRYSPDARETLQNEVIANLGPSVGLALNWADAWKLAGEGQWLRAYEKAAPALFAKPATAFRIGTEGATTRGGEVIGGLYPEEFTTWQLAMQAIGFQPEKLAQAQKAAIQAKTYQQKVFDRRTALLNRLWMERGTPGYADALQKANDFSLLYPELAIDGDAISKSFDARAEAKAQAEAIGAKLDEKLLGRTAPMLRYGMQ